MYSMVVTLRLIISVEALALMEGPVQPVVGDKGDILKQGNSPQCPVLWYFASPRKHKAPLSTTVFALGCGTKFIRVCRCTKRNLHQNFLKKIFPTLNKQDRRNAMG